jgi:hypothetical protein
MMEMVVTYDNKTYIYVLKVRMMLSNEINKFSKVAIFGACKTGCAWS